MKHPSLKLSIAFISLLLIGVTSSFADGSIKITEPAADAMIASPVKVCLSATGVTVEPAKNGVNDGKGHHHILIDTNIPADLSKPITKDNQHVHLGDGSACKELTLSAGKHTIHAVFAKGDHVPYNPAITATVSVNVK